MSKDGLRAAEIVIKLKCECGKDGTEKHSCPFRAYWYGDHHFKCNCCDDCYKLCSDDINTRVPRGIDNE